MKIKEFFLSKEARRCLALAKNMSALTANLYVAGGKVYCREGKREKVAIVGFVDKVRQQAPYNDPEWEVWAFNMANRMDFMKDKAGKLRADRWFDIHQLKAQSKDDLAWITHCPVPLYLTEPYPKNKMAVVYPLQEITKKFACYPSQPFASSFAYAIALAIYEGFTTIGLYGMDLDWGRERAIEHGNLAYWVGLACGLGIRVVIPGDSAFLRHRHRYGFDYDEEKAAVEWRMVKLVFELLGYEKVRTQWEALNKRALSNPDEEKKVSQELWGQYQLDNNGKPVT